MIMKRTLWFIFFLLNSLFYLYADSENDSLLKVLDKVISERLIYTQKKEATIKELKKKKEEKKAEKEKKKQYLDISVENIRIEIVSFTDSNYMLI